MSIWSIDAQTVTHSIQLAVAPVFPDGRGRHDRLGGRTAGAHHRPGAQA